MSHRRETQGRGRRRLYYYCLRILLPALLAWMCLAWLAARALIIEEPLERADALVVFAGSTAYVERAQFAAQLFRENRAAQIILTNDGVPSGYLRAEGRHPLFVERAAHALMRAGVPAERIKVLPGTVASTYEEAALLRRHATEHTLKSLLFVTSAYHSRRARWTLRRVFATSDVRVGVSAPPTGQQMPRPATWWLSVRGWQVVAGEYIKFVYYRLRYH
ncbi:MAG: YdcF family protein [Pyrinomonadaceae bacterium]